MLLILAQTVNMWLLFKFMRTLRVHLLYMLISLLFCSSAEGSRKFEEPRSGTISRPGNKIVVITCGL